MKLFILLKVPQNIVDMKNTESNITITDWEFFRSLAVTIYRTITTLGPTRGYGTTAIENLTIKLRKLQLHQRSIV